MLTAEPMLRLQGQHSWTNDAAARQWQEVQYLASMLVTAVGLIVVYGAILAPRTMLGSSDELRVLLAGAGFLIAMLGFVVRRSLPDA